MRSSPRRSPRGFVLVLVMGLLLVLAILASALASVSLAESNSTIGAAMQTQASSWSIMGAQDALARLRTGSIDWIDLPLCASATTCPTSPPPYVITDPGSRYVVTVFKRGRDAQASMGNGAPVVVLSSTGSSLTNASYGSVIEVEVQMPLNNNNNKNDGTGADF